MNMELVARTRIASKQLPHTPFARAPSAEQTGSRPPQRSRPTSTPCDVDTAGHGRFCAATRLFPVRRAVSPPSCTPNLHIGIASSLSRRTSAGQRAKWRVESRQFCRQILAHFHRLSCQCAALAAFLERIDLSDGVEAARMTSTPESWNGGSCRDCHMPELSFV
ncbi:hypothetical protein P154DRAFT_164234 [Amniculicola lignicola CBS 123094]|uniref:Uncharacterized protein n=1 Tax=Amniculicola lignicola CBS 123094 TaxID=1392246 RepID=A0A6A5WL57_9PLEO|nr:hypothetical protein P154DRAFT_164234 [Amniculicola lignicola CBS 123094]